MLVDELIADLNEIAKTRVHALGGNCIIGYKVDINAFEQNDERRQVYLMVSAIGDAVQLDDCPALFDGEQQQKNTGVTETYDQNESNIASE